MRLYYLVHGGQVPFWDISRERFACSKKELVYSWIVYSDQGHECLSTQIGSRMDSALGCLTFQTRHCTLLLWNDTAG